MFQAIEFYMTPDASKSQPSTFQHHSCTNDFCCTSIQCSGLGQPNASAAINCRIVNKINIGLPCFVLQRRIGIKSFFNVQWQKSYMPTIKLHSRVWAFNHDIYIVHSHDRPIAYQLTNTEMMLLQAGTIVCIHTTIATVIPCMGCRFIIKNRGS